MKFKSAVQAMFVSVAVLALMTLSDCAFAGYSVFAETSMLPKNFCASVLTVPSVCTFSIAAFSWLRNAVSPLRIPNAIVYTHAFPMSLRVGFMNRRLQHDNPFSLQRFRPRYHASPLPLTLHVIESLHSPPTITTIRSGRSDPPPPPDRNHLARATKWKTSFNACCITPLSPDPRPGSRTCCAEPAGASAAHCSPSPSGCS